MTAHLLRSVSCITALLLLTAPDSTKADSQIWETYREIIMSSSDAMAQLLDCIKGLKECSVIENAIKEIFRSYYTRNCSDCCRKRKKMMTEMKAYWEANGMMLRENEIRSNFMET